MKCPICNEETAGELTQRWGPEFAHQRCVKAYSLGGCDARAAIEAHEALRAVPDGWQPIETAPKDKTVLLYGAKRLEMCVGMNHSRDGWVTDTTSEWVSMYPPTHWMPLPDMPSASAPPAPQVVPRKIPIPPAQAEMLDVIYAEGWNQCCDTFFGGLPPQEPVVITITERDEAPAPQASVVQEPVAWMPKTWIERYVSGVGAVTCYLRPKDGWIPLYTHPAPVREPLTDEQVRGLLQQCYDTMGWGPDLNKFARAIESAHGITRKQP